MPSAYTRTGSAVVTLIPVNAGKITINELPVVPWRASSRVMARLRGCAGGSSLLYGAGSFTVLGVGSFTVLGVDSVQPWKPDGKAPHGKLARVKYGALLSWATVRSYRLHRNHHDAAAFE